MFLSLFGLHPGSLTFIIYTLSPILFILQPVWDTDTHTLMSSHWDESRWVYEWHVFVLDICLIVRWAYPNISSTISHWYQARQYMPTLLLTVDYWGEDSHACKVWVGDCLVQDQTTNAEGWSESAQWKTSFNHCTTCHHTELTIWDIVVTGGNQQWNIITG